MTCNRVAFVMNTLPKSLPGTLAAFFFILEAVLIPTNAAQPHQNPETASGKMTLDGKVTNLRHVRARKQVDFWDEKKYTINLLFTEHPSPILDLDSLEQLRQMVKERRTEALEIEIDQKQKVIETKVWSAGSISPDPGYSAQIVTFTEQLTEGKFYTNGPIDFRGRKLEFDVTFKAPLELNILHSPVSARTGKRLPAGGGEPGKAYLQIAEAESAKVREKLKEWSKNPPPNITPEYIARMKEQEDTSTVKVTGGLMEGDRATLDVIVDIPASGEEERARVNLLFRKGKWELTYDARGERTQSRSTRKKR